MGDSAPSAETSGARRGGKGPEAAGAAWREGKQAGMEQWGGEKRGKDQDPTFALTAGHGDQSQRKGIFSQHSGAGAGGCPPPRGSSSWVRVGRPRETPTAPGISAGTRKANRLRPFPTP